MRHRCELSSLDATRGIFGTALIALLLAGSTWELADTHHTILAALTGVGTAGTLAFGIYRYAIPSADY